MRVSGEETARVMTEWGGAPARRGASGAAAVFGTRAVCVWRETPVETRGATPTRAAAANADIVGSRTTCTAFIHGG